MYISVSHCSEYLIKVIIAFALYCMQKRGSVLTCAGLIMYKVVAQLALVLNKIRLAMITDCYEVGETPKLTAIDLNQHLDDCSGIFL